MFCTYHQYYSGDQMKMNEMGGACRKYGEERGHAGFSWGIVRERDHLDRSSRR